MIKLMTKWLIYSASYVFLYIFLILRILINDTIPILTNLLNNIFLVSTLVLLLLLSFVAFYIIRHFRPTERTYSRVKDNKTISMATFILPYAVSIVTIMLDWYGWLILCAIYIVLGIAIIKSENLCLCPSFLIAGYSLYTDESGKYILAQKKKSTINLYLEENGEGIEIRPLTDNLSIMILQKDKQK